MLQAGCIQCNGTSLQNLKCHTGYILRGQKTNGATHPEIGETTIESGENVL